MGLIWCRFHEPPATARSHLIIFIFFYSVKPLDDVEVGIVLEWLHDILDNDEELPDDDDSPEVITIYDSDSDIEVMEPNGKRTRDDDEFHSN